MATTYEKIATNTVSGSSTTSIEFSSISSAYTDLTIVLVGTLPTSNGVRVHFNSDTGNNYSYTSLRGNGTAASSSSATSSPFIDLQQGFSWSDTYTNFNSSVLKPGIDVKQKISHEAINFFSKKNYLNQYKQLLSS